MFKSLFHSRVIGLGFICLIVVLILGMTSTFAATAKTPAVFGQGLEISPPLIELNADPSQTVNTQIKLRNVTKVSIIATTNIDDFVSQGEEGQPKLLLDQNEISPYSLKNWIQPIANTSIGPQQQKTIPIKLSLPKDASPGGHYGVVRFTAKAADQNNPGVSLTASLGSLILVRVSGNISEQASVASFFTSHPGGKQSKLFEYGPVGFTERIQNFGNVHIKPIGSLIIKNMFGGKVADLPVNDPAHNVFPKSIRRFDQTLNKKHLFGHYSANLVLSYGTNKKISAKIAFWVIPYKLIAVILIIIILIVFFGRMLMKRYKKRILAQSRRNSD